MKTFPKAAAWTQTTLCFPLDYLHYLKKRQRKKNAIQLDQVEFCVVLSCCFSLPSPLKHQGMKNYHHIFYQMGKEYPSGDTGEQEKKNLKILSCFVLFFFLLCGKCCLSLLTLPGAHPVCEIFNMRIVPLCSDEKWWFTPFEMYCTFYLFDFFFFLLLKMACTTSSADFRELNWF